ncbi:MAG: hypothetical protein A4E20_17740 [Nitrospira sp. SG-bin2]|nr:MAG: hypothetical protein A4E20_17740 [Nitrospira sp. SG-bin2]
MEDRTEAQRCHESEAVCGTLFVSDWIATNLILQTLARRLIFLMIEWKDGLRKGRGRFLDRN